MPDDIPEASSCWSTADGDESTSPLHELGNLFQMWVAPEHRGKGLGGQLLQTAISWARARSAAAVCLGVTLSDSPAMRLYRRAGFVPSGETGPLPPGSALLAQPMTLCLEASAV
jgi:GNAT superfamily N-acetyltransferase